jgi:streptomycin 6-kinase
VTLAIPRSVAVACAGTAKHAAWLARLPDAVHACAARWSLRLGQPFDGPEVSCSWVAPVLRRDGSPAVLKVGLPHFEARDEIAGLRFWDGNPTARLLEADDALFALLLEPCRPGTPLRDRPEPEQDAVVARLLRRMWRTPPEPHGFRPLSDLTAHWSAETVSQSGRWPDAGLVREGLGLFRELPATTAERVLLATDLHAGNVLGAEREPWLVIDPKPFVGDPAYDATQHLLNGLGRLRADADGTIRALADLLAVDHERVRAWTFARLAAEPRDEWVDDERIALARTIAP